MAYINTLGSLSLESLYVNKLKTNSNLLGNYSSWKLPVVVASSSNITLSGEQTITGTNVVSGDRVLVNGQTNSIENGIYIVSAGSWSRSIDLPVGTVASGTSVVVNGTFNNYICTNNLNSSIVGTNSLIFENNVDGLSSIIIMVTQEKVDNGLFDTIDSSKIYFIDGIINMNGVSIEVPEEGITIKGHGFNYSKLTTTDNNSTIFTSPILGSGDIFLSSFTFDVQGTGSQVFSIKDSNGFHAIELDSINFDNCSSLGYIEDYRQGLETNTGRFGGTPSLEFRGTWLGGYTIRVSIVRNIIDSSYSLFSSAIGHVFNSRFGGDINVVLPSNVTFYTGTESSFVLDASLQFRDAFVNGSGTLLSGLDSSNKKVRISNTTGVLNTYVGGDWTITSPVATTFPLVNTEVKINGVTTYSNLVWFDDNGGTNNSLRIITSLPLEVYIIFTGNVTSGNNKVLTMLIKKYTFLTSSYSTISQASFTTNGAGRFESVTCISGRVMANENDRFELWIENNSDTTSATLGSNSIFTLRESPN